MNKYLAYLNEKYFREINFIKIKSVKMEENIIHFDLNKMGSLDIGSMHKVINAYRDINLDIFESGFNTHSGYVYIALYNGISICSCFDNDVEYLVTNFDNGEEYFYDDYDLALEKLNELSE